MVRSRVMRRVTISAGVALLLLMAPLIFAFGVAVGVFGGLIVTVVITVAVVAPFLNQKQRADRNRKAKVVAGETPRTERIAQELGVPLVRSVRAPEKPVEVIVRVTEGGVSVDARGRGRFPGKCRWAVEFASV